MIVLEKLSSKFTGKKVGGQRSSSSKKTVGTEYLLNECEMVEETFKTKEGNEYDFIAIKRNGRTITSFEKLVTRHELFPNDTSLTAMFNKEMDIETALALFKAKGYTKIIVAEVGTDDNGYNQVLWNAE